jgi:hypothetical protein
MKALVLCACVVLAGCANFDSIYRTIDVNGKAVSIDAKQRAVFSADATKKAVICAEPSPDALSAYGASLSGTFAKSSTEQAQLAAALAEQSASIGLRTQSIQLMRDAMYRACEGYLSGGISEGEFYSLQRRFQNLTLGLLAIEQLTGAVKAEQVALSTSAGAATGDNTEVETAALTKARTDQNAAQDAYDAANLQIGKDATALATARKNVADLKKALAAKPNPTQDEKDAVTAAEGQATAAQNKYDDQKLDTDSKKRTLDSANESVKVAQENLTAARLRVRATASGSASLGQTGAARAAITDKVAAAVQNIVGKVFEESGRGEGCNGIIDDFRAHKDSYPAGSPAENVLNTCLLAKQAEAVTQAQKAGVQLQNIMPLR